MMIPFAETPWREIESGTGADGVFVRDRIRSALALVAVLFHGSFDAANGRSVWRDEIEGEAYATTPGSRVDLYWIPLGAGTPIVQASGRVFERFAAWRQHRLRCDLYHAALILRTTEGRLIIEQAPVPNDDGASRGVVASGPVGSRSAGRFRVFRYEVRCWPGGSIPDIGFAVDSPVVVSEDPDVARRIEASLPEVPTLVWGRDEARTGDVWNSNSVIAWVLTRSGLDLDHVQPPPGGRAPGWSAGRIVAERPTGAGIVPGPATS